MLSAIIFSFSANIDNFLIGMSYGMKKVKISHFHNLLLSIIMAIITFITMTIGNQLTTFLNASIMNQIGSYLLILIGIYGILKSYFKKENNEKKEETTTLDLKTLFSIILILATNNISVGLVASITRIPVFLASYFTFLFSFFLLLIGNKIGYQLYNDKIEKKIDILSSILLILLGIIEL